MQVMEVMSRTVSTIDADANLVRAAAEMKDKNVGILPVLDGDSVAGVVTDRDLVVRGLAMSLDPETTKVSDVMSTGPVIVDMNAPIERAADVLAERKIGRALVVDDSRQVVGVLSMADIALATDDKEMVGDLLIHVSERYF